MKLVRESWSASFAKVETNRKAVLTRGWGPKALNYNVLLHKEIIGTNRSKASSQLTSTIEPNDLNITEGLAGTLVDRICLKYNEESRQHDGAAEEQKKKRQDAAKEKLEKHKKRVSVGLLVSSGQYRIDETVHGYVKRAEDKRMEKQCSEERKKQENYFRLHEKVEKIREKSLLPEKWNSSELATMIQWHRRKGDAKIPTMVAERPQRHLDVCGRGDPPVPELVTADENDIAAADAGAPETDTTAAAGDFVIAAADAGDVAIAASDDDSSDASVIGHEV